LQTLARLIPPQPTEKTAVVVEQKGYRARRRDAGTNAPPRTRMSGGERRHKNCKGAVEAALGFIGGAMRRWRPEKSR
jgi:hypothetical protein